MLFKHRIGNHIRPFVGCCRPYRGHIFSRNSFAGNSLYHCFGSGYPCNVFSCSGLPFLRLPYRKRRIIRSKNFKPRWSNSSGGVYLLSVIYSILSIKTHGDNRAFLHIVQSNSLILSSAAFSMRETYEREISSFSAISCCVSSLQPPMP